jgi:hypothetical protein
MPVKSHDVGPPALLPIRRKMCCGLFIALTNPSPWPGSNPRPLVPVASILTTTPPRRRNKHYFRSRNLALLQDSHSLRGTTRDLWTVYFFTCESHWTGNPAWGTPSQQHNSEGELHTITSLCNHTRARHPAHVMAVDIMQL